METFARLSSVELFLGIALLILTMIWMFVRFDCMSRPVGETEGNWMRYAFNAGMTLFWAGLLGASLSCELLHSFK